MHSMKMTDLFLAELERESVKIRHTLPWLADR
jgi:hypothetical protein